MQMLVWQSQLEKYKLWREEHNLRMCILRKQYDILCITSECKASEILNVFDI